MMTHISMSMVRVKDLTSDKMSLEADADWLADPKNPNLSYNMIGTENSDGSTR